MSIQLRPCPNCNSPYLIMLKHHADADGVIRCQECGFEAPTSHDWNTAETELTKALRDRKAHSAGEGQA